MFVSGNYDEQLQAIVEADEKNKTGYIRRLMNTYDFQWDVELSKEENFKNLARAVSDVEKNLDMWGREVK